MIRLQKRIPIIITSLVIFSSLVFGMQTQVFASPYAPQSPTSTNVIVGNTTSQAKTNDTSIQVIPNSYPINTKCEYLAWVFGQNNLSVIDWIHKKIVADGLSTQAKQLYGNQSQELTNFYQDLYTNYGAGSCNSIHAPAGCEQQLNTLVDKQKKELDTFLINPGLLQEIRKISTQEDFNKFSKEAQNETGCSSTMAILQSTSTSNSSITTVTPITIPPSPTTPSKIPTWVKAIFGYYAQGNLSDDDLIKALEFLIKQGILKVY